MTYETMTYEVADNIATITLNRPDNANALNAKMAEELFDVSVKCDVDPEVRCVILTATGKLFCGGGDLAEMHEAGADQEAHLLTMATILHQGVIRFSKMDAPLIVAVNGTAGGGGFSLVLAGDYVISSDKAKFVSAYTASALTPDGSSTYFLAKHVGLLRAKELAMTNRLLTAEEACEWGMVSKVVPHDTLMDEAMAMARKFAAGPTAAYGGVKRLALTAFSDPMEAQLDKESISISSLMRGHDGPHGIESFLKKEKPSFEGN
ncbi:MAG: enoyl-CoA hydratase/isomerase family protein [Pseudomonadota bacterium]